MSVERRSIGVPTARPLETSAAAPVPDVAAPVTLAPHSSLQEPQLRPALCAPSSAGSLRAETPAASRARLAANARVIERVLAAGGEDHATLVDYLRRFDLVTPPALHAVFGATDPRAAVYVDHPTVRIEPRDIALLADRDAPEERVAMVAALSSHGEPVGFAIQTLAVEGAKRWDYLDFAVVNPQRGSAIGIGNELTAMVDRLATAAGSHEGRLKTAWVGRYYWAQRGYDFATPAERSRVVDYLRRFVAHLGLSASDLRIGDAPFAWDDVKHSWDVARVVSTRGPVEVPGLVAADQHKNVIADIGKAFMLGDWNDPALGQPGLDLFVRNWEGVRQRS